MKIVFMNKLRGTLLPASLTPREKPLLRLHILSALLTGIVNGALLMADATLTKTLGASALEVTALALLTGVSYLGSLFVGGAMRGRRKGPFIILFAIAGRLGLWLLALGSDPIWFLLVVGLSSIAQGLIVTAQISIVKRAYLAEHRATLFGWTISATTLMQLLASVVLGALLDWNEHAYGIYFGLAGVAGFAGALLLARLEARVDRPDSTPTQRDEGALLGGRAGTGAGPVYRPIGTPGVGSILRSMQASARLVMRILREDAPFRRFENNFFLYGVAILMIGPVVPLFLVRDLGLDYTQIGLAKGLMAQAGPIVLPPLLGSLMQRLKPARFCARVFAFLALHPLLLALAGLCAPSLRLPLVFVSFACLGVGMAGISIAWHLSSIHFAGAEDPSSYQSVHTVLTGVRGGAAPLLGYGVIEVGSKIHAFLISAGFFLTGAALMARMARAKPGTRH